MDIVIRKLTSLVQYCWSVYLPELLLERLIYSCYSVNFYCHSLQIYPSSSSLSLALFPFTLRREKHPIFLVSPYGNLQLAVLFCGPGD